MTHTSKEQERARVLFNPYTGTPRHPLDIESDPQGLLIVAPGAELQAARSAQLSKKHNQSVAGLDGGVIRGNPSFDKPQAPKAPPRIIDSSHAEAKR